MKLFLQILLLLVFTTAIAYSQYDTLPQVEYYKVSKVKIFINDRSDIRKLRELGISIEQVKVCENYFETYMDSVQIDNLKKSGYPYEIIINDVTKDYLERTKESREKIKLKKPFKPLGFDYGTMGGFYNYSEVVAQLDAMRNQYPNLITEKDSIGSSLQGRTIWAVKISDNPDVDENEPQVFYNALIHAREPEGMMAVIYFMYYLLENYGTNPEVTYLVDNREFYFVPVINPDGYVYNQQISPNGGGMWRKNRRNSTGVDLARNFGYMWGYDNIGSSPITNYDDYRGSGPFSEPESQTIRDFILSKNFKVIHNFHAYWNVMFTPWGYNMLQTTDSTIYNSVISLATQFNGYKNGNYIPDSYPANGYPCDWNYGEQTLKSKIFSILTEVGDDNDGFWPIPERIFPIAEENVYPNIVLAWAPQVIENPPFISNAVLNEYYIKSLLNPITISAIEFNPDNHSSTVKAQILTLKDSLIDEIELSKIHSTFTGSINFNSTEEGFYKILLKQQGIDIPSNLFYNNLKFTTAGPIEVDTFRVTRLDSNNIYIHNILFSNKSSNCKIPDVSVRIKNISAGATSNDNVKAIGILNPGEIRSLSGGYVLDISQCSSDTVELALNFYSNNYPYWEYKLKFNIPELLNTEGMNVAVYDEMNDAANWLPSGGWGLTNKKYVSAPSSFTDSPSGNYSANTNAILTYKNNIRLLNALHAFLEFDTQWDIEGGYDFGQVQISIDNGLTWSPLNGQYTRITEGGLYSIQPKGQPIYDGTQTDWVHEIMDLSDYLGKPLNLKFLLKSDEYYFYDGWYIDNIKVSYYTNLLSGEPYIERNVRKNIDSNLFRIKLNSLINHQFTPYLIYSDVNKTKSDSTILFDDGLHSDSLANDNIYGAFIPPLNEEGFYSVGFSINDKQDNSYLLNQDVCRFTTSGPLAIDSIIYAKVGDSYYLRPFVHNDGSTLTIKKASIRGICNDPWVNSITSNAINLSDIAPGLSVGVLKWCIVNYIDSLFLNQNKFNLTFQIMVDGWVYWEKDTTLNINIVSVEENKILPTEYSLSQNYPNPFNPTTKIKYSIPQTVGDENFRSVQLKVYDVLGRKVTTLVNEKKEPGQYEVEFNAAYLSSGVYFYQIKAGEFIKTKKMILLK